MNMLFIFLLAVPVLETLRIIILCREMKTLANERGEPVSKWIWRTILVWAGTELLVVSIFLHFWGVEYIIIAIVAAIITARIAFGFVKRDLASRDGAIWNHKIDEIGQSNSPEQTEQD